jgi:hypothetical protein
MRLAVGREAKLQERFLKLQAAKPATGKPAARSSALVARRVRREFPYQCLTNIVIALSAAAVASAASCVKSRIS